MEEIYWVFRSVNVATHVDILFSTKTVIQMVFLYKTVFWLIHHHVTSYGGFKCSGIFFWARSWCHFLQGVAIVYCANLWAVWEPTGHLGGAVSWDELRRYLEHTHRQEIHFWDIRFLLHLSSWMPGNLLSPHFPHPQMLTVLWGKR